MGSSVGISKATTEDDLRHAIETALKYDDKVVIERAVSGRELECAVLGNESPQASVVGEIRPDGDFYSYDAKYDEDSTSETIIPADLSTDIAKRIRDLAVQAYQVAECRGLARVDFFLDEHNRVFINEINTLPGFTDISMYAKLWAHDDINYSNLLDKLIGLALETKRS
jgi:D-alanine-D-alanine ligase